MAIGILLVICTLVNTVFMGATCYPIVAETPSGRLRYKTIAIGRFTYNVAGVIANSITPRMLSSTCTSFIFKVPMVSIWANIRTAWNWGAKAGLFYAGTNLLCLIWCFFRLVYLPLHVRCQHIWDWQPSSQKAKAARSVSWTFCSRNGFQPENSNSPLSMVQFLPSTSKEI